MGDPSSDNESGLDVPPDILGHEEEDRYEIFMPAVSNLVNALGGYEEELNENGEWQYIYRPGDSVLLVLKDLKKLWRKDDSDDERTVARCMYKAGLMKELTALVKECTQRGEWGRKVSLMACDLIAALTWPIDVAQELKEMEDEGPVVSDYATLLRAQVEYKAHILHTDTLRYVLTLMLPHFAKPRREPKDERIISLGLHIVRNLLAIKDVVAPDSATGDKEEFSTLQSALIVQLNKLTFLDLFLTLASGSRKTEFNVYNMLVLDVIHLVLRTTKPHNLAADPKKSPVESLAKLLDEEKRQSQRSSKTATSRHSRFGTTITVRAGQQKVILHSQSAISANAGAVLDDNKRRHAAKLKKSDELTVDTVLTSEALAALQKFTKDLILMCFNNFIESVLVDIRMERSKVRPADSIRALFVASFCMEYLLILRKKVLAPNDTTKAVSDGQDLALTNVDRELPLGSVVHMAELDSLRWVASRMKITLEDKPPSWTELQASIDCFSGILLLLEAMSSSSEPEDVEASRVLQSQLYHNGDILAASLDVISHYKDQSIGYLESVVKFAYVLLRTLQKHSKLQSTMFIRRRAGPRKRKATKSHDNDQPIPEESIYEQEDSDPEVDQPTYQEIAFRFTAFEKSFAKEGVTHTLLAYLERYREITDEDKLRQVVNLMHRQVVNAQAEGLYFTVTCLHLFRRILDDTASLPKGRSSADLIHLINFVLRKFFKRVASDPFLIVEALTAKSKGRWKHLSSHQSDDENDDGMGGQRDRIREKLERLELEFKKNIPWSQQMGVIVAILIEQHHKDWIEWVISNLEVALAARTEILLTVDGQRHLGSAHGEEVSSQLLGPSEDAVSKFRPHELNLESEQYRLAVTSSAHLRLMLKLVGFETTTVQNSEQWFLPPSVSINDMTASRGALTQFLINPPDVAPDHEPVRMKPVRRNRRKGAELVNNPRRRPRKVDEVQKAKSAAFIVDSDDDDEATAAFFLREAELRAEMQAIAEASALALRATEVENQKKAKSSKPISTASEDSEVEGDDTAVDDQGEQPGEEELDVSDEGRRETTDEPAAHSTSSSPHKPRRRRLEDLSDEEPSPPPVRRRLQRTINVEDSD